MLVVRPETVSYEYCLVFAGKRLSARHRILFRDSSRGNDCTGLYSGSSGSNSLASDLFYWKHIKDDSARTAPTASS